MAKALAIEVPITAKDLTGAGYSSAERSSQRFAQNTVRHLGAAESSVSGLGGVLFGLEGSVIGVDKAMLRWAAQGLRDAIQGAREYANTIERAAANTGASVEDVQRWQFALRDAGPEDTIKGMEKLAQLMGEGLRKPTSEAGKLFKDLGIDLRDASGHARSTDQVMFDLADQLKGTTNEAERLAIGAKTMGEEVGKKLAKEMAVGASGIREQMAQAEKLGTIMSADSVAAAKKFDDAMTRADMAAKGLARSIGSDLMPWMTDVIEGMIRGYQAGGLLAGAIEAVGVAIGTLPSNQTDYLQIQIEETDRAASKLQQRMEFLSRQLNARQDVATSPAGKGFMDELNRLNRERQALLQVKRDFQAKLDQAIAPSSAIAGKRMEPAPIPVLAGAGSAGAGARSEDLAKAVADAQKKLAEAKADAFERLKLQEAEELKLVEGSEAGKAAVRERYTILAQQKFDEVTAKQMEAEQKASEALARQHENELRNEAEREKRHLEEVSRIRNDAQVGRTKSPAERQRMQAEQQFNSRLDQLHGAQEAFNSAGPGAEGMGEAERLQALEQALEAETLLREAHRLRIGEIDKAAQAERWKKQDDDRRRTAQTFGALSEMAIAFGKSGHASQKSFAIAEALINTYTGVTAALRQGPRGIPAAALVLAQGLKQVSAIKSTQPGSGGGAGSGFGNIAEAPAPRGSSPFTPAAAIPQVASQVGPTTVYHVTINGSVLKEQELKESFLRFAEDEARGSRSSLQTRQVG